MIESIAGALCWLQAVEAIPWLLELCRTGADDMRTSLAMGLPHFRPQRSDVVEALTTLVTDPTPSVRDLASYANIVSHLCWSNGVYPS